MSQDNLKRYQPHLCGQTSAYPRAVPGKGGSGDSTGSGMPWADSSPGKIPGALL